MSIFHTSVRKNVACTMFRASLTVLLIISIAYGVSFLVSFAYFPSRLDPSGFPNSDLAGSTPAYCSVLFIDQGFLGCTPSPRMHFGGYFGRPGEFFPRVPMRFHFFPSVAYCGDQSPSGFVAPLWMFAVPFLGLAFAFRHSRRMHHPCHCLKCGYDLYGNCNGRCPECGTDNSDIMQREREKEIVFACPQCRSALALESKLSCLVCGAALDPQEIAHEGFHRNAIRPFMPLDRRRIIHGVCLFLQCLRPRTFWKQLVVDPPLTARPLLISWLVCTLGVFLMLLVLSWSATEMVSVSFLTSFILNGIAIPPICCLSVLMFRNLRERGYVSGTNIILCYTYTMPVFSVAVVCCFLVNVMARTGLVLLIGNVLTLGLWTYAVATAFASYPPVRNTTPTPNI